MYIHVNIRVNPCQSDVPISAINMANRIYLLFMVLAQVVVSINGGSPSYHPF